MAQTENLWVHFFYFTVKQDRSVKLVLAVLEREEKSDPVEQRSCCSVIVLLIQEEPVQPAERI